MKGVNIFLADGFEDVEALGTLDILRRGGIDARLVSLSDDMTATSSHGLTVFADTSLEALEEEGIASENDFMIFPGGMPGSKNLAECVKLIDMMNEHYEDGGSVAAICAAPGLVLSQLEDIKEKEFTCYDGFQKYLESKGATFKQAAALKSGRVITGRGPGQALEFGLEILKAIKGETDAESVRNGVFLPCE